MILQLARFGVVGVAAMMVHWLSVVMLVQAGLVPLGANVIAFGIAFNVSYWGHRNWTFGATADHRSTLWRFFAVALCSFMLNELMYYLLLKFTALSYQLALAIVLVAVAALTFALSRQWAFRQP
jgi:putative flippase GtrA